MTVLLTVIICGNSNSVFAQFTFMGDYDKLFAAPKGYYVDPQDPDPTIEENATVFYTGEYAPDGSIIAAGNLQTSSNTVDFYLRKFTPTGAVDVSFGANGFVRTNFYTGVAGSTLVFSYDAAQVLKVQPDGKILAIDGGTSSGNVVRFNPDGSHDQSFGNESYNGTPGLRGRLRVLVTNFNGVSALLEAAQILVRPNGRINLIGYSAAHSGLGIFRAAVSQQNTVFENGIYLDFTNDGKTDIGIFRPSTGAWFYLNSANNQSNGVAFGLGTDKIAPADYDGDGKNDLAIFRSGVWYGLRSGDSSVFGVAYGAATDVPVPAAYLP